jgi:hypothetical protein
VDPVAPAVGKVVHHGLVDPDPVLAAGQVLQAVAVPAAAAVVGTTAAAVVAVLAAASVPRPVALATVAVPVVVAVAAVVVQASEVARPALSGVPAVHRGAVVSPSGRSARNMTRCRPRSSVACGCRTATAR